MWHMRILGGRATLTNMLQRGVRAILRPLRRAVMRASVRLIRLGEVRGFALLIFSGYSKRELFEAKVSAALDLIATYDPARLHRMQQDLGGFALVAAGGDYFDPDINTYVMDLRRIEALPIEHVALGIVHEATHARLHRARIAYTPEMRARIERACVGEEVRFAERLPTGSSLVPQVTKKLETPWWTDQQWEDRMGHQLASYGVPQWLVRVRRKVLGI